MRSGLLAFLLCAVAAFGFSQPANAANKVKVGLLKFGTVSWVLDTIHANGLDLVRRVRRLAEAEGRDGAEQES